MVSKKDLEVKDIGRPREITPTVVQQLERSFQAGLNISEACVANNVARSTFYDYLKYDKSFSDRISVLRTKPQIKAKLNIANAINEGDISTSKWYLEKTSDEFAVKNKHEISGSVEHVQVKQEEVMAQVEKMKLVGES